MFFMCLPCLGVALISCLYFSRMVQVLVGNFGLSFHEQTMQLAVWSIMNAPLLISADLRHARDYQRALLLHNGTLAIDQDVTYSSGIEVTVVSTQLHVFNWRSFSPL